MEFKVFEDDFGKNLIAYEQGNISKPVCLLDTNDLLKLKKVLNIKSKIKKIPPDIEDKILELCAYIKTIKTINPVISLTKLILLSDYITEWIKDNE